MAAGSKLITEILLHDQFGGVGVGVGVVQPWRGIVKEPVHGVRYLVNLCDFERQLMF